MRQAVSQACGYEQVAKAKVSGWVDVPASVKLVVKPQPVAC